MNKKLYLMPTTHCNLHCEHCEISNLPEDYNREKVIDVLNNFNGEIILFGGEPTLYKDRMFDLIETNKKNGLNKIGGISTNLLILDDDFIQFYKEIKYISTSWNPTRFNSIEYKTWLLNCNKLYENGIYINIMITLTNDLIDMNPIDFLNVISEWNSNAILKILFEYYVGDTNKEYFERVDKWLCELYNIWNSPIKNYIEDKVFDWCNYCNDIYTLHPDGTLTNGCPQQKHVKVPDECFSCDRSYICKPCKLQPYCSFPKEFAKLVISKKGGNV